MSEKPILIVNDKSYDEAMHYDRIIAVQVFDLTLTETWKAMHLAPTGERQPSSIAETGRQGRIQLRRRGKS